MENKEMLTSDEKQELLDIIERMNESLDKSNATIDRIMDQLDEILDEIDKLKAKTVDISPYIKY
jgi:uncharacterized coiled-coil protein SlyX